MFKYNIGDKIICDGIELNVYMRNYYDITNARTNKIVGYNTYHLNDSNGNTYTMSEKELMEFDKRSDKMFKYDVGDKVIYKGKECKVIIQEYAKECTKSIVINEHKYYTVMDENGNKYCCNENELRRMRRIDKVLNEENGIDKFAEILSQECENYCSYGSVNCDGMICREGIKAFLNEEIYESDKGLVEVSERKEGSETIRKFELKTPEEHLKNAIKEVNRETNNEFMDIYINVVNEIVDICINKNKDYGSSVVDSYEKFGDISYLTRITDKYNRLISLYQHQDKCKVADEKYEDTIKDLANYCLLWLANRELIKRGE